jgi:hypothetical protein
MLARAPPSLAERHPQEHSPIDHLGLGHDHWLVEAEPVIHEPRPPPDALEAPERCARPDPARHRTRVSTVPPLSRVVSVAEGDSPVVHDALAVLVRPGEEDGRAGDVRGEEDLV